MSGLLKSFFMGGFECATHRRRDRKQIDVIGTTQHDVRADEDYRLLRQAGVRTVRDGLRWHKIETIRGSYDWSSFLPMLEASLQTGTQVIWDLCHWGTPQWVDVFSPEFVTSFAAFAGAAAQIVFERSEAVPFYCMVNEISFWAWVGGDVEAFHPHRRGNGDALKRQLVAASLAGMRAVRAVDRRARFVQAEPVINVVARDAAPEAIVEAARQTAAQFEAWDMMCGHRDASLGGSPAMLDLIGVNVYWNNQWILGGERATLGNHYHKPLHRMLRELWQRYGRPILITETGAENDHAVGWLGYIAAEVRQAIREGVPIEGICLYPVMDYPGWDDERHCSCGLIEADDQWNRRRLRTDLAEEILVQESLMEAANRQRQQWPEADWANFPELQELR